MIHLRQPLRHAVVIRILGFECEFEKHTAHCACEEPAIPSYPPVSSNTAQVCIPIGNQSQANVVVGGGARSYIFSPRRAKRGLHQVVVEERKPYRGLRLFEQINPSLRRLRESGEEHRVAANQFFIGFRADCK